MKKGLKRACRVFFKPLKHKKAKVENFLLSSSSFSLFCLCMILILPLNLLQAKYYYVENTLLK